MDDKAIERFWSKVDVKGEDECWEWMAYRNSDGYGQLAYEDTTVQAHRVSWELQFDTIPDELCVCHHCDNPACCNPFHLFLGTHKDNAIDKVAKGRYKGHDQSGELNPMAKLTRNDIAQIREQYATHEITYSKLAEMYCISKWTVRDIVTRRTWK